MLTNMKPLASLVTMHIATNLFYLAYSFPMYFFLFLFRILLSCTLAMLFAERSLRIVHSEVHVAKTEKNCSTVFVKFYRYFRNVTRFENQFMQTV